jgi:glutamate-1-semialdehyde 2,1-aminomutase
MTAGLTTLELLSKPNFFTELEAKTETLMEGLTRKARAAGIPLTTNYAGGMFGFFFSEEERVTTYAQATACHMDHFRTFFHGMLKEGVYLAPSAFEAGFISSAHSETDLEATLAAAERVLATV